MRRAALQRLLIAGALGTMLSTAAFAADPTEEEKFGSAEHPITLTFWSWGNGDAAQLAADYKKDHPFVTIENTIFGGSGEVYSKLGVVFKAGTGAPDLSSMELMNMPSFAAPGYLADLSQFGGKAENFDPGAAASSTYNGTLYAIPTDTGPLVMYYNAKLFEEAGIEVPTTWAEYRAAAEKLKAAGKKFIAHMDPGDPSLFMGLMQQAGSVPFKLSGQADLTVDLTDEGATKVAEFWSSLLDDGLVDPEPGWSAEWFNGLANGTYATWLTGAWGGSVLAGSIPQVNGEWRVALLPQWEEGAMSNGVWGGSATVVTEQSQKKAAATAFAQWFAEDQFLGRLDNIANMPFPASQKVLQDPRFAQAKSEFLGGQMPGELYIEASKAVDADWQFLPYQLYANTIYKDTFGQAVDGDHDLLAGLQAWQDKIVAFGVEQGFNVIAK